MDLSFSMRDLGPWPGIKPGPLVLGAESLSHWTPREVSSSPFFTTITSLAQTPYCRDLCRITDFLSPSPMQQAPQPVRHLHGCWRTHQAGQWTACGPSKTGFISLRCRIRLRHRLSFHWQERGACHGQQRKSHCFYHKIFQMNLNLQ